MQPSNHHPHHPHHHDHPSHALAPHFRGKPFGKDRKERGFLETVLGAPKAAVNQEPYVNTGLLQRPKRSAPEPDLQSSRVDDDHVYEEEEDALTPSHQLDLSPRIMMRGRETRTRFSGSGIFANLVAQVGSLWFIQLPKIGYFAVS
jgi:hypothetical protein